MRDKSEIRIPEIRKKAEIRIPNRRRRPIILLLVLFATITAGRAELVLAEKGKAKCVIGFDSGGQAVHFHAGVHFEPAPDRRVCVAKCDLQAVDVKIAGGNLPAARRYNHYLAGPVGRRLWLS